jgi:hypothetical protein
MVSLLVLARGEPGKWGEVYAEVLNEIESIVSREADSRPLTFDKIMAMKQRFSLRNLKAELVLRMTEKISLKKRARILLGAGMAVVAVFIGVRLRKSLFPGFDPMKYVNDLAANTDFRKFDDMLRMISDCAPQERERLVEMLERRRAQGQIVYGLHVSTHALMTCLVFTTEDHIHFIDGSGGGYAMAARQLKDQLKAV